VSESKSGTKPGRLHFVANCVYGTHFGGGDTHFYQMARAAIKAGWRLHFFGGHALKHHLREQGITAEQTLTDRRMMPPIRPATLGGQFCLLWDYLKRFTRTVFQLGKIQRADVAYAVTDFWFDVWPLLLCRAQRKIMILGMDAPTLMEIIRCSRPDVPPVRLNSIYYWASQFISLRLFRCCRNKQLLYVHPMMKPSLLALGYRESELTYVSNGMDLALADATLEQQKQFDVVWIGRFHRQKGIADLVATLVHLRTSCPDFRAVLIGQLERELKPQLQALGLLESVTFAGLVSDAEKFRLFKTSRVMLMPSTYESWGIVIAEALACGVPVVAYDLAAYRPVFGDLVRYAPCFDVEIFKRLSLEAVQAGRTGGVMLDTAKLAGFREESSWEAAGKRYLKSVQKLNQ